MRILYNLGVRCMGVGIRLAALFNPKARLWIRGRNDIFKRMAQVVEPGSDVAWFHAASLGEFEQGRPVIEAFRAEYPDYKVLVTFFSPSGYEVRKNYTGADYIFYLPLDTPGNVRRFIRIFRPKIAVFVKYEFWVNYLWALRDSGARVFIISSIFRPEQSFFRWYGGLFRKALGCFEHIFVQNQESLDLLGSIGVTQVSIAGDTRFDRVYAIATGAKVLPAVEQFADGARVFVAGSTWPADEQLLLELIHANPGVKFIIAPHEIDPTRIERMMSQTGRLCLRYTQLTLESDLAATEVLFIDTIGILSSVYRYGRWGYIGGGFGAGIHNTLEAATFGLPLAFGPKYEKFQEARNLIALGGAVSVSDSAQLMEWFGRLCDDPKLYTHSSAACRDYVVSHKGATQQIMDRITSR